MSKDKGNRSEKKAPASTKKEKKAAKAAKRAGKNNINIDTNE
jgi:hypothetical protein